MKNLILVGLILAVVLTACKDEFNLPVYDSYVDGDAPSFEILYPNEDTTILNKDSVNIQIICKDDYEIERTFKTSSFQNRFNFHMFKSLRIRQSICHTYQSVYCTIE